MDMHSMDMRPTDASLPRLYGAEPRPRPALPAILRGFRGRCPACGTGRLFRRFLKITDNCSVCGEDFSHHQADDAPPYFTIMIVGHIVVPLMLWLELEYLPPLWVHATIWPALTLLLSLWFLPRIKGAVVSWQWALRMHGFGEEPEF
tara:strand:+ start:254 stop:694 length:441 start_codon:yes stop_codon:yes gene_type:complete